MKRIPWMIVAAAAPLACGAQGTAPVQQKVSGPQARYWLSAETATGMSMSAMQGGGLSAMMGAMMGGGGPRKSLRLELGSVREGNPAEASHAIPPGMNMGAALPLLGPERAPAEPVERDVPEWRETEKPKGRMLFFWGCGESVGPGQPVVLDFAKIADGQLPPDMRSAFVRVPRSGPGFGRDRGYADWPNRRDSTAVPGNASMVGAHRVSGNFAPEIRFSVEPPHDFMEALRLAQERQASGAHRLSWNRVPTSLGHFATAMGVKEGATRDAAADMVFWNSSAVRLIGGEQLMGWLPPAETERLVRERVVMPADTTECLVPKEVLAAAGGTLMMVNLNAFGPELNVVHPPRPQDPKIEWKQEYTVKLRLRSYTGSIGGMEERAASGQRRSEPAQTKAEEPKPPSAADAVKGVLRGILGR